MKVYVTAAAVLVLGISSPAETSDELKKQLITELNAASKEGSDKEDPKNENDKQQARAWATGLARPLELENPQALEQILLQIATCGLSERIQHLAEKLEQQARTERKEQEAQQITDWTGTISSALHTGIAATEVEELDQPLADLEKIARQDQGSRPDYQLIRLVQSAQSAKEFLRQLQDLITGPIVSGGTTPRNRLQNLLSSQYDFSGFIPRSEILKRLKQSADEETPDSPQIGDELAGTAHKLLRSVQNLEELDDVFQQIGPFVALPFQDPDDRDLLKSIRDIYDTYNDIKSGVGTALTLQKLGGWSADGKSHANALRLQLFRFALPRILQLPAEDVMKSEDSILSYLLRTLEAAKKARDWPLAGRILDVAQKLDLGPIGGSVKDSEAITTQLAGLNQEQAQQYGLAVCSYLAALKTGSRVISAIEIGEHLAAIKKEHPEEFAKGQTAPPVPTREQIEDYLRTSGYPPHGSVGPRGQPPGYPPNMRTEPSTPEAPQKIIVPAAPVPSAAPAAQTPAPAAPAIPPGSAIAPAPAPASGNSLPPTTPLPKVPSAPGVPASPAAEVARPPAASAQPQ